MTPLTQKNERNENSKENELMGTLYSQLEKGIADMEAGRVQTLDDAWKEIDAV